jgi:hypothetical protein
MVVTNYNLNRRIRQALYTLKRAFGSTVTFYKLLDAVTEYHTGVKTSSTTAYTIARCIVLPVRIQREVVQTISIISANKEFVQGGSYDAGQREFVIDARDLPVIPRQDDYLVYNDRRYEFKQIYELEQRTGWHIVAKEVLGPGVIRASASDAMTITIEAENES